MICPKKRVSCTGASPKEATAATVANTPAVSPGRMLRAATRNKVPIRQKKLATCQNMVTVDPIPNKRYIFSKRNPEKGG